VLASLLRKGEQKNTTDVELSDAESEVLMALYSGVTSLQRCACKYHPQKTPSAEVRVTSRRGRRVSTAPKRPVSRIWWL